MAAAVEKRFKKIPPTLVLRLSYSLRRRWCLRMNVGH